MREREKEKEEEEEEGEKGGGKRGEEKDGGKVGDGELSKRGHQVQRKQIFWSWLFMKGGRRMEDKEQDGGEWRMEGDKRGWRRKRSWRRWRRIERERTYVVG